MGDEDAGHSLLVTQLSDQIQQMIGIIVVQGGCGLIQNQQPDVLGQRLGDLHQLLLAHSKVHDPGVGFLVQPHTLQQTRGLGPRRVPVHYAIVGLLIAQEDVLGNG